MKTRATWIVVADHQRARVFLDDGSGGRIQPVDDMTMEVHLGASHELDSHPPDIGFSARGGVAHGYEPRSDPHERAALDFLERLIAGLSQGLNRAAFDRLVLVAPPKALGELRRRLPSPLRQRVAGELNQDLTKASATEVQKHLEKLTLR